MTKPLTEEQKRSLAGCGSDADTALARLDFLERKVQAADKLRDEARYGSPSLGLRLTVQYYDEVTE